MPSINEFKSMVAGGSGLALANRFKISFTLPASARANLAEMYDESVDGETLNLLCDATGLPGRQIMTIDYQAHKQNIKIPYGFINEDVNFTFLLTSDYYVKKVFDAWTKSTINFNTYRANYLTNHITNIEIIQQHKGKERDEDIYGVRLINAYPTTIGMIGLENTAENTIQKLAVTITYENFEILD